MMVIGRFRVLFLAACVLAGSLCAHPAAAEEAKTAADGPGRGDLKGFVVTPQTDGGGNRAFLIAPNGAWFLATSHYASTMRLIDITSGITLRYFTAPGLHISAVSISPDSKAVFARGDEGKIVAWDAATGRAITTASPTDFHDITRLSLYYDSNDEAHRPTSENLARYHLQTHFPDMKKNDVITFNPTQEYAIVGYAGDPRWNAFQIWNVKKEQTELFFRLDENMCGYPPFSFDYDGKHLIFGNAHGFSNHLDFTVLRIDRYGPTDGPKTAEASRSLRDDCRFPQNFDFGFQQEFGISPGAQVITKGGGMPGTPEWSAWDLRNGRKIASIHPDGHGIVSADGSTFVVVQGPDVLDAPPNQLTVQRYGKRKTVKLPQNLQSEGLEVLVSPNGQWIALRLAETIAVWSATDGKPVKEFQTGHDHPAIMLRVSDKGDPLLVDDKNGAAFINGRWRTLRTVEHGLIVPLTPNFQAQCGAIFCDRVIAGFGVVERQPRDDRAGNAARVDLSPDGRFMTVLTRDKAGSLSHDVIDIADGHVVLHDKTGSFTSDGLSLVVRETGEEGDVSFVKYDLPTARRVWTAFPDRAEDGFYMIFAGGRVRYSKTPSLDFALVRGFEVRLFDGAAAKQFIAPPSAADDTP